MLEPVECCERGRGEPGQENAEQEKWAEKLARRLQALTPGRYVILLTVDRRPDWTVQALGKVERP